MQQRFFRAMGCEMLIALDGGDPAQAEQIEQAIGWFAGWEACLSRFQGGSELARLNRGAGRPVPVGEVLWEVLQAALQGCAASGGLVTPTLLPALEAAGYDRSFEQIGRAGGLALERASVDASHDWRAIAIDPARRTVGLPAGMRLDLGGVAKGWAADRAARALRRHAPALVDAGGDIAVSGPMTDGSPWPIAVADPREPDAQLALILLYAGGVATSGRDYRHWRQGGAEQHHIIDPRTGRPAATDVLSATVIGPSAREAELAAKVALILGGRAGMDWIEARPWLAGLLVLEDGAQLRSARLDDYLWQAEVG